MECIELKNLCESKSFVEMLHALHARQNLFVNALNFTAVRIVTNLEHDLCLHLMPEETCKVLSINAAQQVELQFCQRFEESITTTTISWEDLETKFGKVHSDRDITLTEHVKIHDHRTYLYIGKTLKPRYQNLKLGFGEGRILPATIYKITNINRFQKTFELSFQHPHSARPKKLKLHLADAHLFQPCANAEADDAERRILILKRMQKCAALIHKWSEEQGEQSEALRAQKAGNMTALPEKREQNQVLRPQMAAAMTAFQAKITAFETASQETAEHTDEARPPKKQKTT